MKPVITGISKLTSSEMPEALIKLEGRIKQVRFVNDIESLALAASGSLLDNAGISFPVGSAGISICLGIDDSVEDIKDEYFSGIVREGVLGASPLLFPYTTANAFAAQISIAFDIRGESITMPVNDSMRDVIEYAVACIEQKYAKMSVAGRIFKAPDKGYSAEFFFLEERNSALKRGATIYTQDSMDDEFRPD